jgi:hypothetical protein
MTNNGCKFTTSDGNTIPEWENPEKLKHFSGQVAMEEQSPHTLSHGFVLCGQQSMSSIAAMLATSDFATAAALPAIGSIATERAIRSATMVRATFMESKNSRFHRPAVK